MSPKEITTLAGHRLLPPWVMKLALEVAEAEREVCAKVCEEELNDDWDTPAKSAIANCAAAIRARGEK